MSISFTPSQVLAIARAQGLCTFKTPGIPDDVYAGAILVVRALGRFEREFESYRVSRRHLQAVREYHRLLIDEVALFDKLYRKGTFSGSS